MDGTTAKFYENAGCMAAFHNKGFFKNLLPYESMLGAMSMLRQRADVYVYVLSAVADSHGANEKESWMAEHLPDTVPVGCFFCRPGESKAEYVRDFYGELTADDILLDDYSVNLKDWVDHGGSAVKVLNEHNGRGWNGVNFRGPSVSTDWTAEMIYEVLCRQFDLPVPDKRQQTLTVMVGLPGSGKSTTAQKLMDAEPNLALVSSDMIRKEMFGDERIQSDAASVFTEVNKRINFLLKAGKSVLYDATNLYASSREHVLEAIPEGLDVIVRFWVVNTPLETCLRRNTLRERVVPEDVVRRMHNRYQAPKKDEYAGTCIIVNA